MTQEALRYQYRVTSKWCGFWGGWGSEADIGQHIESETVDGWHLVSTKNMWALWFWVFPRPKVMFIYQRAA